MELREDLKLIIFDFDGTLYHLAVDWAAIAAELDATGRLGDAIADLRRQDDPRLALVTRSELAAVRAQPLDAGVVDLLEELGNHYRLAILTRNSRIAVQVACRGVSLDRDLYIVGREDVVEMKPEPEGVARILRHFAVTPAEAVLVGDTHHDVRAARAAGVSSIVVRNCRLAFVPPGADFYVDKLGDIWSLLD